MSDLVRRKKIAAISKKIVEYNRFQKGCEYVSDFIKADSSNTLLLYGQTGCGKKTVVNKVIASLSDSLDIIKIVLDPYVLLDDVVAMRFVGECFNMRKEDRNSAQLVMNQIISTHSKQHDKIVVVLENIDMFCRGGQSLLYSLSSLCHEISNLKIIGLTRTIDCVMLLEKRVRSRFSPRILRLTFPYLNKDEYVEFASLLLDGYKFDKDVIKGLHLLYETRERNITYLTRWLVERCEWNEKGKVIVRHIPDSSKTYHAMLIERLESLTFKQYQLFKLIVAFDSFSRQDDTSSKGYSNLLILTDFAFKLNFKKIDLKEPEMIIHMTDLKELGLISAPKVKSSCITRNSLFAANVSGAEFLEALTWTEPLIEDINSCSLLNVIKKCNFTD